MVAAATLSFTITEDIMSVQFLETTIEAIFKGAYVKTKAAGSPADILAEMRELDPDVKFKEAFPVYGKGGRGKQRDTKNGKVVSITIKSNNGSKYIDLACECDDGDVTVAVGKKKVDDFLAGAKEKLGEDYASKIDKPSATIIIRDESKLIPIAFFDIDGKRYFDSFDGGGNGN